MEAYKVFDRDDYFLRQLDDMHNSLKELAVIMDENNRAQMMGRLPQYMVHQHQHQWRRTPKWRTPTLMFPFNLIAQAIQALLNGCEQAVGWLVKNVIGRWMQHVFVWQRNRRRA